MKGKGVSGGVWTLSALLLQGCASLTLSTEAERDWESAVEAQRFADTDAYMARERLVVANTNNVALVDADSGAIVGSIGDDARWQGTVSVEGREVYKLRAESSNAVTLSDSGLVVVLDYQLASERVTAVELASGEKRWSLDDYRFSVQQYEQVLGQLLDGVAESIGATSESLYQQRARQRHFAERLFASVDDGQGLLFKTFEGLVMLDPYSGAERWRVEEFSGPGIQQARTLDNGDYLVLSTPRNTGKLQAAQAYHLARISPRGELRWLAETSGRDTAYMTVAEGRVVVDASPVQVFDLTSGEHLWSNEIQRRTARFEGGNNPAALPQPDVLVHDGRLYQAAWTHQPDQITMGTPHRIRAWALDSGELLWETPESSSFFGELQIVDGKLLVWGSGEYFGDEGGGGLKALDPQSGETLWATPQMATAGMFSAAPRITAPVQDAAGKQIYIAGPEQLFSVDIASGELLLEVDVGALDVGNSLGLVADDAHLVLVGTGGVAGLGWADGETRFATETEIVTDYERIGDRVLLHVAGGLMGMAAEETAGVRTVDIASGKAGKLVGWDETAPSLYGVFQGGGVVISEDGRRLYRVDEETRRLVAYRI